MTNFFVRAWRGEVPAWKPFWLILLPAWLVSQLLATWAGLLLLALALIVVPLPLAIALGVVVVLAILAGAVLYWRSALNVRWKALGYVGRVGLVAMMALLGLDVFRAATGMGAPGQLRQLAEPIPAPTPPAQEPQLLVAAHQGDLALVRKLLDAGESPHQQSTESPNKGRTALHYAAGGSRYQPKGQHLQVVKLLLERGADVNAKADTGYTALHVASGLGQAEMVELLLQRGADIDALDLRGTALQAAVLQGDEAVVEVLIRGKANLKGSLAILDVASQYKPEHTAILRRLLDAGGDPNDEYQGFDAFHGVVTRNEEATQLLISRGADLGAVRRSRDRPRLFMLAEQGYVRALVLAFEKRYSPVLRAQDGSTLLHVTGNPEVVDLLIARGVQVDATDRDGNQPLHAAASRGNREVAAHLIAKGARVNAANGEGRTPVMNVQGYDGRKTDTEVLDLLIDKGADLKLRDRRGYAALDVAAESHNSMIVKRLLERGAAADARDRNGYTALYRARSAEIAEALLAAGAGAKATALDGKTPLHLAAATGEDVVDVILKQGIDVNASDKAGQTPIFAATRREGAVKMLLDAGAAATVADREGKTPMHYAASSNVASVKLLLAKGARLDVRDKAGNTPLHEAARGNVNAYQVRTLIELGADPDSRNRDGKTPAQLAQEAAGAQARETFSRRAPKNK